MGSAHVDMLVLAIDLGRRALVVEYSLSPLSMDFGSTAEECVELQGRTLRFELLVAFASCVCMCSVAILAQAASARVPNRSSFPFVSGLLERQHKASLLSLISREPQLFVPAQDARLYCRSGLAGYG